MCVCMCVCVPENVHYCVYVYVCVCVVCKCVCPDIVYLGVLHTQHLHVGLMFLNAGKNVLCEKPFAMNSGEVKQLIDAAKKNRVFLMEVQTTGRQRLTPVTNAKKESQRGRVAKNQKEGGRHTHTQWEGNREREGIHGSF